MQSIEIDDDDEEMKHSSSSEIATYDVDIGEEITRETDDFETGKYEDVICFPPRETTAVALRSDSSYLSTLMQVPDDCSQSQDCRKDNIDSDENINDVCDSENNLRNVLDQRSNSENLFHCNNIEIQHDDADLSMQNDTENIDVENSGTEKSLIILKNVISPNGSLGIMDENVLQDIPVDAVITDSIEEQIGRTLIDLKSYQISKISASQSLARDYSNCNEKTHQQDNNNIQNNCENCDQHVTKCHRISSFNELHGSVTAPFRSDMSTSSDASDNCAVVSLSDDDDSNNQSSDRDDEILTPNNDQSLVAFLNKKHVDVVIIKPENQTAMNLAIEIDDFPPPL